MKRIKELEHLIKIHKAMYYKGYDSIEDVDGKEYLPISDVEFDMLEEELRTLDPNNDILKSVGTTTESKYVHKYPMLSIEKTKSIKDLEELSKKDFLVGTYKMDGSACSLIYKNSIFELAVTRGDGEKGEIITENISYINFPKLLSIYNIEIEIRGEVVISKENFELLKTEMIRRGLGEPERIRNIVSGLLHRKEHKDLCQYLDFVSYNIMGHEFETYNNILDELHNLDFKIPQRSRIAINEFIEYYKDNKDSYQYLTDGLVFRINNNKIADELGKTEHHFRHSLAYKLDSETAIVKVKEIEREVNKTGKISYVAIFDPVELSGANITRVTLHNAKISKTVNVGAEIEITRSNEVIPYLLRVIKAVDTEINMLCPSCNSLLKWSETRVDLVCKNIECNGIKIKQLKHFIKTIEIDGLGESTVEKLYNNGFINDFSDLFNITENVFLNVEGFQKKSAKKLYEAIQDKKIIPMEKFLSALSIDGLGDKVGKDIKEEFGNIEEFIKFTTTNAIEDTMIRLSSIPGIAETISSSVACNFMYIESVYKSLIKYGVKIEDKKSLIEVQDSIYSGKKFIISGSTNLGKEELYNIIIKNGGLKVSTVKASDFLITSERHNKYQDAMKYGKTVMSEQEFLNSLGE